MVFRVKQMCQQELIKSKGFALFAELISLLMFGLGFVVLSNLSNQSISLNSESLQRVNASFLADSIVARIQINLDDARAMAYNTTGGYCKDNPQTRADADINTLFCPSETNSNTQSKIIDIMGNVNLEISCAYGCEEGTMLDIVVEWKAASRFGGDTKSIKREILL